MEPVICPCCHQAVARPSPSLLLSTLRLQRGERIIAEELARHFGKPVPSVRLIDAMYAHDIDGGPEEASRSVDVRVCLLRRKLRSVGLAIESVGRAGRRMVYA